jgi:hypothetical protein
VVSGTHHARNRPGAAGATPPSNVTNGWSVADDADSSWFDAPVGAGGVIWMVLAIVFRSPG